MLLNPTGSGKIRGEDAHGNGKYLAGRVDRKHAGVDIVCIPGDPIYAPCSGVILRKIRVYPDDPRWSGCEIACRGRHIRVRLYYVTVTPARLVGTLVKRGQTIGFAQNIGLKYPGITPHIHMGVTIDPTVLYEYDGNTYIDPSTAGLILDWNDAREVLANFA